jgi:hypothetical protein
MSSTSFSRSTAVVASDARRAWQSQVPYTVAREVD